MTIDDLSVKFEEYHMIHSLLNMQSKIETIYFLLTKGLSEEEKKEAEKVMQNDFASRFVALGLTSQGLSATKSEVDALKAEIIARYYKS